MVRRKLWGFETGNENVEQVLRGEYQGLRVAFGYPSAPDHSLKRDVFRLLGVEQASHMRLTPNNMINPGESVCGLIFADRGARYFGLGRVGADQIADYAARRGMSHRQVEGMIPPHAL